MSERSRRLFVPTRKTLILLVVLLSCANVITESVVVSKFRKIFEDDLPGMKLPDLTQFILDNQPYLIIATIAWLGLGLWIIYQARAAWLAPLFAIMTAQIAVTVYALIIPMTHIVIGMSAAH
jgi:hypothetical protein